MTAILSPPHQEPCAQPHITPDEAIGCHPKVTASSGGDRMLKLAVSLHDPELS
jgi:hypothetical protein